jgi:hypothetical protein
MNYAINMGGSSAMICITNFILIGLEIQKLMEGTHSRETA